MRLTAAQFRELEWIAQAGTTGVLSKAKKGLGQHQVLANRGLISLAWKSTGLDRGMRVTPAGLFALREHKERSG